MDNQDYNTLQANNNPIMSIGDWVIILILMAIPIVNIVLLIMWAFGSNTPATKANFAKATLIFMVIGIVLWIFVGGSILAAIMAVGLSS